MVKVINSIQLDKFIWIVFSQNNITNYGLGFFFLICIHLLEYLRNYEFPPDQSSKTEELKVKMEGWGVLYNFILTVNDYTHLMP